MNVYFDTNVLNSLAYIQNNEIIFKKFKKLGINIYISEVVIFEVLRDQEDLYNIDCIIKMLQTASKICNLSVLPSINSVLANYIDNEHIYSQKENVISEVLDNDDKEFKIDIKSIENITTGFKYMCKQFNKLIKQTYNKACGLKTNYEVCCGEINNLALHIAGFVFINDFFLFDSKTNRLFWENKNISSFEDKVKYINSIANRITKKNSPFINIAYMLLSQKQSMNNGTLLDGFNLCYLSFIDILVSNDKHYEMLVQSETLDSFLELVGIRIIGDNN